MHPHSGEVVDNDLLPMPNNAVQVEEKLVPKHLSLWKPARTRKPIAYLPMGKRAIATLYFAGNC